MSLKKILGLESFPINNSEIMRKIVEAQRNNIETIEFSSGIKKVRINISNIPSSKIIWQQSDYRGTWL
jgi:hypothetical protein